MRHYFIVDTNYKQNKELHKSETYLDVNLEDDNMLDKVMKHCEDTTREAFTRELANTDGQLISVTTRVISEIEYKRYSLSKQAKLNKLQMRGAN